MIPLVAAAIKWGLPLLAGAIASKGQELVQEKLGIDLSSALGTEEGRIKLKQLEMEHQEFLINAAQATEARELDYFKEEVKDTQSARTTNAQIATSDLAPWYQKALMPLMAVLVTIGFFGSMFALFWISFNNVQLDDNSRDILIYAFGAMTAGWMSIMNYLFGSSHGSRQSQEALAAIAKGGQK